MTPRRLAVGLAIGLAAASPAPAQTPNIFERMFGTSKPAEPPAPAPAAPAPPQPSSAVEAPPKPAAAPPRRPAAANAPAKANPQPVAPPQVAAAGDPAAPRAPLTDKEIVERANAYFNGINAMTGDFVQVGGDGRRMSGQIAMQRPGKLRFEYRAPSTLEVIADGSTVAVRDRKLATQDLYPIGQTPLKFLTRDRVDLGRDVKVTEVERDADEVRLALEDRSTLGGTSKITLFFDPEVQTLAKWRIVDPQGFATTVSLANLDKTRRVDPSQFVINYQRVLGESSR